MDEKEKDLEESVEEEKIDWSQCVPNEYFILYQTPEVQAKKEEYMNKIRKALKESGFQIIDESKHVPRIHASYQGKLKPEEVVRLDLSRYNITKIEPVPMAESYDKQVTLE